MKTLNTETLDGYLSNGGATLFFLRDSEMFVDFSKVLVSGYGVSALGGLVVKMDTPKDDMVKMILKFAKDMVGGFVGLWVDGNDLYIDKTIVVNDLIKAKEMGVKNNQKAIYDFGGGKVVAV
jgi:hypothetical protein